MTFVTVLCNILYNFFLSYGPFLYGIVDWILEKVPVRNEGGSNRPVARPMLQGCQLCIGQIMWYKVCKIFILGTLSMHCDGVSVLVKYGFQR